MLGAQLKLTVLLTACGLWIESGGQRARADGPTTPEASEAQASRSVDHARARRLALQAHAQAAAISKLPRFDYQARYRHGIVDSMRARSMFLSSCSERV